MALSPIQELQMLLRPAGGGVYVVSSGTQEQLSLQKQLYGVATQDAVTTQWRAQFDKIASARIVMLGIPSDVGAGYARGANLGPQAIRTELLRQVLDWPTRAAARGIVDIGDVFVVPQLLHDDMLSDSQKDASRVALYPELNPNTAATLPVSPLSIAERVMDLVFAINPRAVPVAIGGDHSTAWPIVAALHRVLAKESWAIVQVDAHTDLLQHRLGVKYCFATWSYHANDLLNRGGRLVQVGTRASRHDRGHWENGLGVKQFWSPGCLENPRGTIDAIVAHLTRVGVRSIYFSNDIDGTDSSIADATGTPESGGLSDEFVVTLIRALASKFTFCGGDIMEVAPLLERRSGGAAKTLQVATHYLRETIDAIAGAPLA